MAALLGGWRLPRGARVGFTRSEYASTLMLLHRLAARNGWTLVDLPADDHGRLDLDALAAALASGLDLVTLPHIASHRGIVQPAAEIGRLCREAGTPLVLDVCQSLGHVDVTGIGAIAYVGTSRKWLAGPRGVGFLIVPAPTPDMDAATPTLASHEWTSTPPAPVPREGVPLGVEPKAGAGRYEGGEAAVAAWVGFGVAVMEHHALGPAAVYAHLAELGEAARHALDGRGGWRVVEPFGEPSAIVTLRPPEGADAASLAARAAEEGVVVGVVPVARAPLDLREPVLRVSPPPGTGPETLEALARLLEKG
ncbi:MAG: aminotransferase class V-fold PLP-dependent enzyme [Nonomuraea sp.]|nr:aminotransferase class V-fold PLP-dependent enzyme [Nonomuraea sp.]